jgi:hypothetical protein
MSIDKVKDNQSKSYVEVIGDTVYGKHLVGSIVVSILLSLSLFFIGKKVFPLIAPEEMVHSYSLLLGIAGSVSALILNSFLYKPKRKLNETPSTNQDLSEVYEDLQLDIDEEQESILHDPVITKEMKEQGIYEMFLPDKRGNK